jgi:hypothetical protein
MKKIFLIFVCLYWLHISFTQANATYKTDTTKAVKGKYMFLWLRQPVSILPVNGMDGTFKTDEKGFYFIPRNEKVKHSFGVSYYHVFKDIFIEWESIEKIKRRPSHFFTFYMKNTLFIKTKDGKKFFFMTYHKKAIIREYQKYISTKSE